MLQRLKESYYQHPRAYSWISIIVVFGLAISAISYSRQKNVSLSEFTYNFGKQNSVIVAGEENQKDQPSDSASIDYIENTIPQEVEGVSFKSPQFVFQDGLFLMKSDIVSSREIKRHAVEAKDIDSNSVTSRTMKDHTIQGEDIAKDADLKIGSLSVTGDITANGMVYGSFSGFFAPAGDIDMVNHLLVNIGNTGTDFTSLGGLNLAGNFHVNSGKFFVDSTTGNVGIGTTNPLSMLHVGNYTANNSVDSQILISRIVGDSISGNGHAFSDSSNITRSGIISYNSYDARITFSGTHDYGHYAAFQANPTYGSSGTINQIFGLFTNPTINTGTATNVYGAYVYNSTGTGTITNNYGLYTESLTKGTNNFAVYTAGTTSSQFGGKIGIGTGATAPVAGIEVVDNTGILIRNPDAGATDKAIGITFAASQTYGSSARIGIYARQESAVAPYGQGFNFKTYSESFSPALATRMALLGNGSLGLGTTSPSSKLEIWGTDSGATTGDFIVDTAQTGGVVYIGRLSATSSTGNKMVVRGRTGGETFVVNNQSGVSYFNVGNVGIGTTNPLSKLGVLGNLSVGATYGAIAAPTSGAIFEGNVGIGTTSPKGPLQIGNQVDTLSDEPQVLISRIVDNTGSGNAHAFVDTSAVSRSTGGPIGYNSFDAYAQFGGSNISFDHYAAFQARPRHGNTGTIGIVAGLSFIPTISYGTVTEMKGVNIYDWVKPYSAHVTTNYGVYIANLNNADTNYAIYTNGTTKSYFGGNVGIGTTSPGSKLQVTSTADEDVVTVSDSDGTCTLDPESGGSWSCTSDERLKTNINPVLDALDRIIALRPVSFKMKAGGDTNYGFIAQEVQEVIPEAVSTLPNGYLGVAEGKFTPYIVGAIQQLSSTQDKQQAQITGLTDNQNKIVEQITNQLADTTLTVDQKITLIGKNLDNLSNEEIKTIKDKISSANGDISDISDRVATLEDQMKEIRLQNSEEGMGLIETRLGNIEIALNVDESDVNIIGNLSVVGNVNLLAGKLTAQDIEVLGTMKAKDVEAEKSVKGETLSGEKLELGKEIRGKGELKAGNKEVKIESAIVSKDDQIYITSLGKLNGGSLYVNMDDVKEGESFKVRLDGEALKQDIQFNWLIIK